MFKDEVKKILLIEDGELVINLLQKKLEKEGYKVLIARNGVEGMEKIRDNIPDLILLDIVMPRMGGFEVMGEIIKDRKLRSIPVIVISNSGQQAELDRAKRLGAKGWLIKTKFDPKKAINKIKQQIG